MATKKRSKKPVKKAAKKTTKKATKKKAAKKKAAKKTPAPKNVGPKVKRPLSGAAAVAVAKKLAKQLGTPETLPDAIKRRVREMTQPLPPLLQPPKKKPTAPKVPPLLAIAETDEPIETSGEMVDPATFRVSRSWLEDIEKRIAKLEKSMSALVSIPVDQLLKKAATEDAPTVSKITDVPGIEIVDGNVQVDENETWRWTEAHILAFAKEMGVYDMVVEHIGKPRRMRRTLFDWMRGEGLKPTDTPPSGVQVLDDVGGPVEHLLATAKEHKKFRLGFTGTQHGMTKEQRSVLRKLLTDLGDVTNISEFHHGDCVGADEEAHAIARAYKIDVYVHPGDNTEKRAFVAGQVKTFPKKPNIERNHDIVQASDYIIAAPKTPMEELRSGTWTTVRYAKKAGVGKSVLVIAPDGSVS